jgi:hypothetical protein
MLATNCLYSASSITPSTLRGQDGITTNKGNTANICQKGEDAGTNHHRNRLTRQTGGTVK